MQTQKIVWLEIHAAELMKREKEILPEGFSLIRPTSLTDKAEHLQLIQDADYIIAGRIPITAEYIAAAKKLKMIQKWGIGVDKIDCIAAKARNIPVYITAGSNAIPVAELTLGLMLAVSRKIPYVSRTMREGMWVRTEMRSQCYMLNGKRVGLLGIGNIAKKVARMLYGFGAEVIYFDLFRLPEEQENELHISYVSFDELLRTSDILSIHVPLMDSTRGMIGASEIAQMKESAILINTARGFIVDEAALIDALQNKRLRGAGIDAFEKEPVDPDNPLLQMDHVVCTCHVGGAASDNVIPVTEHAYHNILSYSKGEPVDHRDVVVAKREFEEEGGRL